jgi:hypothetical protein
VSSGDIDDKAFSKQELERLFQDHFKIYDFVFYQKHPIVRLYDVPYLGGISNNGDCVYLDRHLSTLLLIDSRQCDPSGYLRLHETIEYACVTFLNWSYEHAHHAGNGGERMAVEADQLNWDGYNKALEPYIKAGKTERILYPPPDLALYPYADNKKILEALTSS